MSTVELRFSALPSHVRTARLVAAAVARRAGVDESVLDEVRLAVGEACSRAVGLHRRIRPDEPVTVTLVLQAGRFSIEVADRVPAGEGLEAADRGALDAVAGAGRLPLDRGAAVDRPVTSGASLEDRVDGPGPVPATAVSSPAADAPGRLAGRPVGGVRTVSRPAAAGPSAAGTERAARIGDDRTGEEEAELLPGSMCLAVISGLVDDLDVQSGPGGAVIRMSWPATGAARDREGPARAG
jgi:Histidine kinase-like ATPase domain